MSSQQQLQKLLHFTGKTQTELAQLLGVSFVTLNSWVHAKSTPRKTAQERIDLFFQEYTGYAVIENSVIAEKKKRIRAYQKQFPNPLRFILNRKDIYDSFVLALTYHTNSIEGSTFTEPEVRAVLFDNATIPNKTVIEHQEAKNHQAAFGNLIHFLSQPKTRRVITEEQIKRLHAILMNGIRSDAGLYRQHGVRITGSNVPTANYLKVPDRMVQFIPQLQNQGKHDVLGRITKAHAEFEQIHPFADGNGRVGRLIMQAQLLQHGLPPIIVHQEKKQAYYTYLQRAQLQQQYHFLEAFFCDGLLAAYRLMDSESQ